MLVKMQMASICGTDLHYVYYGWPRNEYPMAPGEPGHEGVGVVEDPGPHEPARGRARPDGAEHMGGAQLRCLPGGFAAFHRRTPG